MSRKSQDDCYFYYNTACSKGVHCQFRHCEAAKLTQEICQAWQAGSCLDMDCTLRHMIPAPMKDRSRIACYWENQSGGCRKPHCPFSHTKPRDDMGTILSEEEKLASITSPPPHQVMPMASEEEAVAKFYTSAPPHIPDISSSAQSSPKVEQLVINPFDEESDGDSVHGTPVKSVVSQRLQDLKVPLRSNSKQNLALLTESGLIEDTNVLPGSTDDDGDQDLNFSVKSLDEIRREKLARAKRLIEEADSLFSLEHKISADNTTTSGHTPIRDALQKVASKQSASGVPTQKAGNVEDSTSKKPAMTKSMAQVSNQSAPQKHVIKLAGEKPTASEKGSAGVEVKSFEEICREKALASLRAAQEKKRLEAEKNAKNDNIESKSNAVKSEPHKTPFGDRMKNAKDRRRQILFEKQHQRRLRKTSDSRNIEHSDDSRSVIAARRVVQKGDESSDEPDKRTIKSRLGTAAPPRVTSVKDRLGLGASGKQAQRKGIRDRLGFTEHKKAVLPDEALESSIDHFSDKDTDDESLRSDDSLLQSDFSDNDEGTRTQRKRTQSSDEGIENQASEQETEALEDLLKQRQMLLASLEDSEKSKKEEKAKAPASHKRRIQLTTVSDEVSPPKKRIIQAQEDNTQNKFFFRKVFVDSEETKVAPKQSLKSRLGNKTDFQITRTVDIGNNEDKTSATLTSNTEKKGISTKKRRIAAVNMVDNDKALVAKKRVRGMQLYRPPGAKQETFMQEKRGKRQRQVLTQEVEEDKSTNEDESHSGSAEKTLDEPADVLSLARESMRKRMLGDKDTSPKQNKASKRKASAVKTFSEVMREKQLRKQQQQQPAVEDDADSIDDAIINQNIDLSIDPDNITPSVKRKRSDNPINMKNPLSNPISKALVQNKAVDNKNNETKPKRTVKRNVWSSRDARQASSVPIERSRDEVRLDAGDSEDLFGTTNKFSRDIKTKSNVHSRLAERLGTSKKGRSPLLRTQEDISEETSLKSGPKVPISPIVLNARAQKPSLVTQITPIGIKSRSKQSQSASSRVPISPVVLGKSRNKMPPKQSAAVTRKSEKDLSQSWERPAFLKVQIPKPADIETKDKSVKSPKKSPGALISPSGTARRRSGSSQGRRASTASKSEKVDDLTEVDLLDAELLELEGAEPPGGAGDVIDIPDDDELLMEMQELLS